MKMCFDLKSLFDTKKYYRLSLGDENVMGIFPENVVGLKSGPAQGTARAS